MYGCVRAERTKLTSQNNATIKRSGTVQGDFVIGLQIQLRGYDWSDPENTRT